MPFQEGEQVNGYTVMEQLGRGGMATVFKAYHASLDRYVALKVMHPVFMEDDNFQARFQREARVVAKLDHPNIIPVYDFSVHNGLTYLVMKYIEGKTLKARLQEGEISSEENVEFIEAIGAALSYAHEQGVLHRDVKPSNVILADDGQIFLADFGLARIASAGESTLSSDMMIGTPQYISPEQALGEHDLGPATDIYSFGVVIYELVVGQVPYSSDTPFAVVHDHIYKPLPLPRVVNPDVPEAIERILLKALAKSSDDRFESVDEMVKSFKRAVEGDPLPEVKHIPSVVAPPPDPSTIAAPVPVPEEVTAPTPEKKKRKFKWWYIPIILGLCFCSLVVLSNNSNDDQPGLFDRGQNDQVQTPDDNEAPDDNSPSQNETSNDNPLDEPAPDDEPRDLDAELDAALANVEENPDDPYAHLELAAVYFVLDRQADATEAYEDALVLGGDDPEFYVVAGDMLAERGLWILALTQYVQAAETGDFENDEGLLNRLRQSVYKAAEDPKLKTLLEDTENQDEPLVQVARARYTLLHGEGPKKALELIDDVINQNQNLPEAFLVKAEIWIALGEDTQATQILERLTQENTPPWIEDEIQRLIDQISE